MGFGIRTDHFGIGGTFCRVVSDNINPEAANAQAEDSLGDILDETVYGEDTSYQNEYKVGADTSFATAIKLGSVVNGKVITGLQATRNNKDELLVAVTGEDTAGFRDSVADTLPTFDVPWPASYLTGGVGAKMAGLATVAAGRVVGSSINASVQVIKGEDSQGNIKRKYLHGGRAEASNDVQTIDTQPAVTYDTANGWAKAAGSGAVQTQSQDYESGTFAAFQNIVRD